MNGIKHIIFEELKVYLNEYADRFQINNKMFTFHDGGTYPFGIVSKTGKFAVGKEKSTHQEMGMYSQNKAGRLWSRFKIISFWDYPETIDELEAMLKRINIALKYNEETFHVDDTWFVEFNRFDIDSDDENDTRESFLVPISDHTMYLQAVKKPSVAYQEMEKRHGQHTISPMKKMHVDIPSGWGSKKVHEPEWAGVFKESKENYKKLLKEVRKIVKKEVRKYIEENVI
jgi:hypothetical protein